MPEKPEAVGSVKYSDAVTPLLDWSFSPGSVSQVVSSVVGCEAQLTSPDPAHHAWYDNYCLLVSDYLCTAMAGLSPALTAPTKEAVSLVTRYLLDRLVTSQCPALVPAILALAGGHSLQPEVRAEKQSALSCPDSAPGHVVTGEPGAQTGQEEGRLPQTDLSAGLLDCLSQETEAGRDLNIPGLLTSLNTGPAILTFLTNSQPGLAPFISAWRQVAAGSSLDIPPLAPDGLKPLLEEVILTQRLLRLPLFSCLSPPDMVRMSSVSFSCLLAALASTRLPGDLAQSDLADSLVSHCLEVVRAVTRISKFSSRLGAATRMNLTSSSVWLILSGLRSHLSSPPPRTSPGTLALAGEALTGLELLTGDLGSERDADCDPASLDISAQWSGLARLKLVLGSAPVMQLLLQLASQLHQAAATISSMEFIPETVHETPDVMDMADPMLGLDEDDLVLGLWMMRLLTPVSGQMSAASSVPAVKTDSSPLAVSYLSLSATILSWLSSTISSPHPYLQVYTTTSLSPDLIHSLSFLLKESDSRAVRELSSWPQFSTALSSLSHQLISAPLPDTLVSLLLSDLSLSPTAPVTASWPLAGSRRSLSILAQVLLRRQAKDAGVFSQYVNIWERAITSVATAAMATNPSSNLSLANIHLLLLIFHSLQLMQKKTVVLTLARKLREVCEATKSPPPAHSCLLLGKLAMIMDYLVRHLYEPPSSLLPQIKKNLFSLGGSEGAAHHLPPFLQVKEEEEASYYLLYPAPSYSLHSLEVPKLDGLAVSFLLSTPDVLDFPQFYRALLDSLQPLLLSRAGKAAHYCFLLVWRLLQSLPPPASVMAAMLDLARSEDSARLGYGQTLHCLLLAPRAANKAFSNWMKDCLVKQGLPAAEAETLIKAVGSEVNCLGFEVRLIREYLSEVEAKTDLVSADLLILDCLMGKLQISLDQTFNTSKPGGSEAVSLTNMTSSLPSAVAAAQKLVPCVSRLLDKFAGAARTKVIQTFSAGCERDVEPPTHQALVHSLCLGGTRCPATASLALPVTAHLPPGLRAGLEDWVGASITGYPTAAAWRNQFAGDPIPGETYLATTIAAHAGYLSSSSSSLSSPALKHSLFSAARFACDLIIWCPDSGPLQTQLVSSLFPLLLDCTTENLADLVTLSLERVVGTGETDQFLANIYSLVVQHGYPILVSHGTTQPHHASQNIPSEILRFLDQMLDKSVGRAALAQFCSQSAGPGLTEVLLSITSSQCPEYAQRVLMFFNKLFSLAEKHSDEAAVVALCGQLSGLVEVPRSRLESWLSYLVVGMFQSGGGAGGQEDTLTENRSLLQSLTGHIVR